MEHTTPSTWLYWIDKAPADKAIMAEINRAMMGNHVFLDEVRDLEMDCGVYARRMRDVVTAERAFLDAGGHFGGWKDGYFIEPAGDGNLMRAFIDAQTFLRLEALRLLDARAAARVAKAEKAARKAAEAAEKAILKAAREAEAHAARMKSAKM